ncbi:MAG: extracellular solute-binding protein [Spirochaetaceae bacterium]|nr:MAG: extracellular solute-binding protein [Spirochaetaceae bacterium]
MSIENRRTIKLCVTGFVVIMALLVSTSVFARGSAEARPDTYAIQMILWPGPESDAFAAVASHWNNNIGPDLGITVEVILFGRDQMHLRQEAIMAAGSDEVDVFQIGSVRYGRYLPFLEPIDPYFDDPEINRWGASPDNMMQGVLSPYIVDGNLMGVPRDVSVHYLYYRQDLMDELLSNSDWQARYRELSREHLGQAMDPKDPDDWTWDDYLAASYFFTRAYNPDSPTEYGNFTHGRVMGPTGFLWTNAMWGHGGDWYGPDGRVTFDTEASRRALEIWGTSFQQGLTPPGSVTGEYPESNEAMISGQVAMGVHWNAAFSTAIETPDSPVQGKFNIVAPPAGPEGRFAYNHSLGYALNTNSSHKRETMTFLTWLFTDEANEIYARAGGIPPVAPILADLTDMRPDFGVMADVLDNYGRALPPQTGAIEVLAAEYLSDIWTGSVSADRGLPELERDAQREIDEVMRR